MKNSVVAPHLSTPAASGDLRALPDEILEQTCRRVGIASMVFAGHLGLGSYHEHSDVAHHGTDSVPHRYRPVESVQPDRRDRHRVVRGHGGRRGSPAPSTEPADRYRSRVGGPQRAAHRIGQLAHHPTGLVSGSRDLIHVYHHPRLSDDCPGRTLPYAGGRIPRGVDGSAVVQRLDRAGKRL